MTTHGPQPVGQLPTFTDEKLEEYLGIWTRLIDRGHRKMLDITLQMDYKIDRVLQNPWLSPWINTLTYGEEKRELTYEQAFRVKEWLDSLPKWRYQ